jgi:hypothetical protein
MIKFSIKQDDVPQIHVVGSLQCEEDVKNMNYVMRHDSSKYKHG